MSLLRRAFVFVFRHCPGGNAASEDALSPAVATESLMQCGGIGLDSRDALLAKKAEYNLMVILSLENGHYLGGALISVRDHAGETVFRINAKGPWVFVKLSPGTVHSRSNCTQRYPEEPGPHREGKGTQARPSHVDIDAIDDHYAMLSTELRQPKRSASMTARLQRTRAALAKRPHVYSRLFRT
jgi:hypothetical protein